MASALRVPGGCDAEAVVRSQDAVAALIGLRADVLMHQLTLSPPSPNLA